MRLSTSLCLLAAAILAQASSSIASTDAKVLTCNANTIPTTCPKGQYCKAATKGPSTCAKTLEGGAPCSKDDSCRSEICFISKTVGGKKIKRNCARFPAINFELGAQCTLSPQCESGFCDAGFCEKPVPAGEKCPKDSGCAQLSIGAECLHGKETYIVYDSAGKKSTKNLSAGHCSYVRNLGEGMKCSSNANCYGEKFVCSTKTKTCTAKKSAGCSSSSDCGPTEWCTDTHVCKAKGSYGASCSTGISCLSDSCVTVSMGRRGGPNFIKMCGCQDNSSCLDDDHYCASDSTCHNKMGYGQICTSQDQCRDSAPCVSSAPVTRRLTSGPSEICGCTSSDVCDTSTDFCNLQTNLCTIKQAHKEACDSSDQCASGTCVSGSCGCEAADCDASTQFCASDFTCQAKLAYGTTCTDASQCTGNICQASGVDRRGPAPGGLTCGCSFDAAGDAQCIHLDYDFCSSDGYCAYHGGR